FTGILAPVGTPQDVLSRLHEGLEKALADKAVVERFEALGAEARAMSPQQFTAYLKAEYDKWTPVIRKADVKAN
ncbi:MAG TPA: tripartite tricarboxylate transporter substrate-binding protein, partial [Burkholderiaceae bacterium]|nr:tripartite tricarboxylate transporter substrate-binding protein [Burkholderiaceae bacterium]